MFFGITIQENTGFVNPKIPVFSPFMPLQEIIVKNIQILLVIICYFSDTIFHFSSFIVTRSVL